MTLDSIHGAFSRIDQTEPVKEFSFIKLALCNVLRQNDLRQSETLPPFRYFIRFSPYSTVILLFQFTCLDP